MNYAKYCNIFFAATLKTVIANFVVLLCSPGGQGQTGGTGRGQSEGSGGGGWGRGGGLLGGAERIPGRINPLCGPHTFSAFLSLLQGAVVFMILGLASSLVPSDTLVFLRGLLLSSSW